MWEGKKSTLKFFYRFGDWVSIQEISFLAKIITKVCIKFFAQNLKSFERSSVLEMSLYLSCLTR